MLKMTYFVVFISPIIVMSLMLCSWWKWHLLVYILMLQKSITNHA